MMTHTSQEWTHDIHVETFFNDSECVGEITTPHGVLRMMDCDTDDQEEVLKLATAAPQLLTALRMMVFAYEELTSNVNNGTMQEYKFINDAPIAAQALLAKLKEIYKSECDKAA